MSNKKYRSLLTGVDMIIIDEQAWPNVALYISN